ncbi:PepSY-associated TM helix domain-containing protein [soil metagenome]
MSEVSFGAVRRWLRAIHRDLGYLAVGLTIVYALSGLAVNHIADWDPNFRNSEHTSELGAFAPGKTDDEIADDVATKLAIEGRPKEVYRLSDDALEVLYEHRTLHVNTVTGRVVDEQQQPRFLIRAANFLHLNRGKKAWTYFADGYAVGLLFLAISGLFMIPGEKGIVGRGAVFLAVGVAIPVLYVTLSK